VGFVADINARSVGMYDFQAEVFALDLARHLASLLAVHLVPMVLRWMVGCSFGRAVLLFQDNARRHLHNRQNRSHALHRAGTLQGKCGLSCRARLCLGF
jgi:hypothetical protein